MIFEQGNIMAVPEWCISNKSTFWFCFCKAVSSSLQCFMHLMPNDCSCLIWNVDAECASADEDIVFTLIEFLSKTCLIWTHSQWIQSQLRKCWVQIDEFLQDGVLASLHDGLLKKNLRQPTWLKEAAEPRSARQSWLWGVGSYGSHAANREGLRAARQLHTHAGGLLRIWFGPFDQGDVVDVCLILRNFVCFFGSWPPWGTWNNRIFEVKFCISFQLCLW